MGFLKSNSAKAFFLMGFFVLLVFTGNFFIMETNNNKKFFLGVDALNHISTIINQKQDYQPLSTLIMSLLINPNKTVFFYFIHVFLLFVVIPFLLFKISQHYLSVLFYYSSYFVWLSDNNATLPQTLVILLLLVMFLVKNNYARLAIVFISFGVHSFGWIILLAWFFMLNFKEHPEKFWFLVPCATPKTALTFYQPSLKQKVIENLIHSTKADLLNVFSRILFLPLWFFAIKGLLCKENRPWLLLTIFLLLGGVFSNVGGNLRIFSILVFPLAIGLTHQYKKSSVFLKRAILLFVLMQLVFNLVSWVERKNILYCDFIVNNHLDFTEKTGVNV